MATRKKGFPAGTVGVFVAGIVTASLFTGDKNQKDSASATNTIATADPTPEPRSPIVSTNKILVEELPVEESTPVQFSAPIEDVPAGAADAERAVLTQVRANPMVIVGLSVDSLSGLLQLDEKGFAKGTSTVGGSKVWSFTASFDGLQYTVQYNGRNPDEIEKLVARVTGMAPEKTVTNRAATFIGQVASLGSNSEGARQASSWAATNTGTTTAREFGSLRHSLVSVKGVRELQVTTTAHSDTLVGKPRPKPRIDPVPRSDVATRTSETASHSSSATPRYRPKYTYPSSTRSTSTNSSRSSPSGRYSSSSLCGARTQKGTSCRNRLRGGGRCHHHR